MTNFEERLLFISSDDDICEVSFITSKTGVSCKILINNGDDWEGFSSTSELSEAMERAFKSFSDDRKEWNKHW